jgi:hypothetical protein
MMNRNLIRAGMVAALGLAGVVLAAGAASAAEQRTAPAAGDAIALGPYDAYPFDAYGYDTDNDTRASAHNSGSGSVAVNTAGDGNAHQWADQTRPDHSVRSRVENNSQTDSHNEYNSHNKSRFEDSHNTRVHPPYPPYPPPPPPPFGPFGP